MAKRKVLDVRGYYRALKVSPEVPQEEVRLAYAMAKQNAAGPQLKRIELAFEVLNSREKRKQYDTEGIAKFNPLKSPWTLVGAIVVLVASVLLLWIPEIRMRGKRFQPGQTLVETSTRREFGVIVRVESTHRFPEGITAPGYLVRLAEGGEERWFPAIDLQASCETR